MISPHDSPLSFFLQKSAQNHGTPRILRAILKNCRHDVILFIERIHGKAQHSLVGMSKMRSYVYSIA